MLCLFINSRKRGTDGARRKCAVRTIECYERNLRIFIDFLTTTATEAPIVDYNNLTKHQVIEFLDWLDTKEASKEWSRATALQMLRCLKAFFRWVDQDEDCQAAGLKGKQRCLPAIEKNPRRMDIPELGEIDNFLKPFKQHTKLGYRNYVATCLMLTNGIRIGELCSLLTDNMLLTEKRLVVVGKQGKRTVPITDKMVTLLKGWMKMRERFKTASSPYVFVSLDSEKMTEGSFGQAFSKHRKKYKLPRITSHTFRHVFATNYLREGGGIEKLKRITGHKSLATLEIYLHDAQIGTKASQDELERVSILKGMSA